MTRNYLPCRQCGARLLPPRRPAAVETGALFDALWRRVGKDNSFRSSNPEEVRR